MFLKPRLAKSERVGMANLQGRRKVLVVEVCFQRLAVTTVQRELNAVEGRVDESLIMVCRTVVGRLKNLCLDNLAAALDVSSHLLVLPEQ